ncbi:hypothetical protein [Rubrivirga sp.]|uniref:hypothetical protein n=1 Tax=Rubrivirga sp. TaxID=1885344 RepID=UPI003B520C18
MPVPLRLLVLLVALAPVAGAQMLPSGTWTGTLTDADGDRHAIEAEIERCASGFTVDVTVDGRTATVSEDAPAIWERGRLRFTTSRVRLPGALLPRALACDLSADAEGALRGTCAVGRGRVRMELVPPADAAFGCD